MRVVRRNFKNEEEDGLEDESESRHQIKVNHSSEWVLLHLYSP